MARWPGGLIRKTPVTPAGNYQSAAAPGVWTLAEASYWTKQGLWPTQGVIPFIMGYMTDGSSLYSYGSYTDPSGNIYIVGNGSTGKYGAIKITEAGVTSWNKGSTTTGVINPIYDAAAQSIVSDGTSNIFLLGQYNAGSYPAVLKIDFSGVLQSQLYYNTGSGTANSMSLRNDASGNLYACYNNYNSSTGGYSVVVSKLNSSLANQWTRAFDDGLGSQVYNAVAATDASGNVYVGTFANSNYIVKYNSSGTVQWSKAINGAGMRIKDMATDSSGNVYCLGSLGDLIKFDATGSILWQLSLKNGASNVYLNRIVIDTDDSIYMVATDASPGNICIFKYNTSGTLQWQRTISQSSNFNYPQIFLNSSGMYITSWSGVAADGSFFAKLPKDGSKTGTYTVGARSYVYAASSLSQITPTYTVANATLTHFTPSISTSSPGTVLTNRTFTTQSTLF